MSGDQAYLKDAKDEIIFPRYYWFINWFNPLCINTQLQEFTIWFWHLSLGTLEYIFPWVCYIWMCCAFLIVGSQRTRNLPTYLALQRIKHISMLSKSFLLLLLCSFLTFSKLLQNTLIISTCTQGRKKVSLLTLKGWGKWSTVYLGELFHALQ